MNNTDGQKTTPFFKFENLRIYHKSITFATAMLAIYDLANTESDRLVAKRLFKAASMITNNIAEGSCTSKSEFIGFLLQAKGKIRECVILSEILLNRKVIDEEQSNDIRNELIELTKMTGALIVSLQGETNQMQTSNC